MIGFRKTGLLITALVMLMAIGMAVDNFNLSAVAFGAMVVLPAFYFNEAEPVFYVWIYRETSLGFLKKKAWFAIVNLLIYALPAMILLMVVFQAQWWIPPLIFIGGMVFMLVMITAKYAVYPSEIGIAQAVLLYLSFQLPPLLLVVVPLFIKRSKRNLQSYLS